MKYYRCNECKKIYLIADDEKDSKCKLCDSNDTISVTKEFATDYEKDDYNKNKLLKKAEQYLKDKDYDNAFCFANMSNIDNEKSYNAFIIKVLSSYKVNNIEALSSVKDDLEENNDLKSSISLANKTNKSRLIRIMNKNQENVKKTKYKEANKLLKEPSINNLRDACRIFSSLEDYKDSKKRLALCRDKIKKQSEEYVSLRKKNENIKVVSVASIILVIIVMIILILLY